LEAKQLLFSLLVFVIEIFLWLLFLNNFLQILR